MKAKCLIISTIQYNAIQFEVKLGSFNVSYFGNAQFICIKCVDKVKLFYNVVDDGNESTMVYNSPM